MTSTRTTILAVGGTVAATAAVVAATFVPAHRDRPASAPAASVAVSSPTAGGAAATRQGTTGPARSEGRRIPDGFPLATGWPTSDEDGPGSHFGLQSPGRHLPALTFDACGATLPAPEADDRLSAAWSQPEDYRERMLVAFTDRAAATAYVDSALDFFRACPTEAVDDDFTRVTDVRSLGAGASAVRRGWQFQGSPSVGLELVRFTQVGDLVLVETGSNEGNAGPGPEFDAYLRANTAHQQAVLAAMRALTDAD